MDGPCHSKDSKKKDLKHVLWFELTCWGRKTRTLPALPNRGCRNTWPIFVLPKIACREYYLVNLYVKSQGYKIPSSCLGSAEKLVFTVLGVCNNMAQSYWPQERRPTKPTMFELSPANQRQIFEAFLCILSLK